MSVIWTPRRAIPGRGRVGVVQALEGDKQNGKGLFWVIEDGAGRWKLGVAKERCNGSQLALEWTAQHCGSVEGACSSGSSVEQEVRSNFRRPQGEVVTGAGPGSGSTPF